MLKRINWFIIWEYELGVFGVVNEFCFYWSFDLDCVSIVFGFGWNELYLMIFNGEFGVFVIIVLLNKDDKVLNFI